MLRPVSQVADRLGDAATSQMAEALAQELVEVDWDDPSAMEKQELMSSLTEDLQRQVMQHMPAAFSSSASKWPLGMRLVRHLLRTKPSNSEDLQPVDVGMSCNSR